MEKKLYCIDYVKPNNLFYKDGRLNIRHMRCKDEECFKSCLTLILSFGGKLIDLYFGNAIKGKISDMEIPLIVDKEDWYNLSREEEIQKLIDKEMGVDNYGSFDYQVSVCDGVKFADKTLIKKACEWLKENIDIYAKVVINHKSNYPEIVMCDTFEKNFIKAMER